MRKICFYHAGCPDGFGAAWAAWRAWGEAATYVPRGHDDALDPRDFQGALVVFADIAPPPESAEPLAERAERLVVLDHHVSALGRYTADPDLLEVLRAGGHEIVFDLERSGAVLAWRHFHPGREVPDLLRYIEDQDLWRWKLPATREVNAAIGAVPRTFACWDELAGADAETLAAEGRPIVRAQQREIERALHHAHPVQVGDLRLEAVNAREQRSLVGHELASRALFGTPCGVVYRLVGRRVDVSIYSVGEFDVAALAGRFGGGGHRNAAGFHLPLQDWLDRFVV